MDMSTLFSLIARHLLSGAGVWLAAHGLVCATGCSPGQITAEQFVGAGMALVAVLWSVWQKWGQAIVAAQLARLKDHVAAIPDPMAGGPLARVADKVDAAKAVAGALVLVIMLAGLWAPQARAQTGITGTTKTPAPIASSASNIFGLNALTQSPIIRQIQQWTDDDISAAIALSTSIQGLSDDVGHACWVAMAPIGKVVKAHPLPATLNLASDIQAARLFLRAIKQVCMTPECTQVFQDISNQAAAFAPIPIGVTLNTICSKIP